MEKQTQTEKEVSLYGQKGLKLPEGIKLSDLDENWKLATREYMEIRKRMQVLDAVDSGKLWEKLCKKFPQYQIAPDTNHVNYIKENILASIYTVGKGASLIPRRPEDEEVTTQINQVMDTLWDILDVPSYQQKAGERAALLNLGVTQVGWNQDITGGTEGAWYKGDVVFKNINPANYFRDPFSTSLQDASFVITFEDHSLVALESNKMYAEAMKYYKKYTGGTTKEAVHYEQDRDTVMRSPDNPKYERLIIHWIKVPKDGGGYKIHEIHTINNSFVLYVVEDLKINMFPFAELYCNEPGANLVGVSEPDKILASSVVVNILDGIIATHAYKAQRPPRIINPESGINIRQFAKYGNDPDKVFMSNRPASEVVDYIQFPPLPDGIYSQVERLDANIKNMSGIDERYTGKDTGSILTTGGIESMLAQSTMRDTTKINLYEKYTKDLSRLVIKHLIIHGDTRAYAVKDEFSNTYKTIELDFPNVDKDIEFQYALHISNQLPKNKMRLAQAADAIMEKSLQYQDPTGETPPLMEPEEWLSFQDFPQKDVILERMKQDRMMAKEQEVMMVLSLFTGLLSQGVSPEEALGMTVDSISNPEAMSEMGMQEGGGLGSVGNETEMGQGFGPTIQDRQQG